MAAGCWAQVVENNHNDCCNTLVNARHNTKNVVIDRIHANLRGEIRANSVVGQSQLQDRIVNTGEVAAAAGLVLLRLQGEGVHVDTDSGDVGVVLVRLDKVEVLALTLREAIVAVQLNLGGNHGVLAGQALHTGDGVTGLKNSAVKPVRVVEGLLALPGASDGIITRHEAVALDNPHKLLTGVVEVQLDLVRAGGDRLTTSELQLLNQVLVRDLGEAAALIRVQVDVVNIQGRGDKASGGNAVADGVGGTGRGIVKAQVAKLVELQPDLDLVVLQGDQGQRKTRVAAEPELQGDVQGVLRGAHANLGGGGGLNIGRAVIIAVLAALDEQVDQLRDVADHLGVTGLLAGLLGQLIPDVEPVAIMLVNLLTTDLNVDVVDQVVANPVEPAELRTRTVRLLKDNLGEGGLQVDTVDQITVAADRALHLLAEVGRAVEGLLNRLHGEVSVATVDNLEDKVYPPFRDISEPLLSRDWTIT